MNKFKENLKKIWSKITESKLNISMFVAGVIAFVLLAVILGIIIHRDGQINNELIITGEKNDESTTQTTQMTTENEIETTSKPEEQYSTKIDENATTNVVSKATRLSASISVKNSWTNDGEYFIQYNLDVTNISDNDIDGWALVLDMARSYTLVDSWNYNFKSGNKKLIINPFNDNRKIPAGETVSGGFIVKGASNVYVDYITVYVGNKIETIKNGNTYIPVATSGRPTKDDSTTTIPGDDTTAAIQTSTNNEPTKGNNPDNQPQEPNNPDNPDDQPQEPNNPDNPDNKPQEPNNPDNPDDQPQVPDNPDNPDDQPQEPNNPDNPDNKPQEPNNPDNPDDQLQVPNNPDNPDNPVN